MKNSLSLGKIAGIKLSVHWTFIFLILWIIISGITAGNSGLQIAWSMLFILSIFACVVLHELGHALAARRYKINTIDITLLPIGGIARLESMPENPWEELMVSLAGPLVNFMLALIAYPFVHFPDTLLAAENFETKNSNNFLLNFFVVNITLGIFNLIPAFPMDGGRVLRAILSFRLNRVLATRIAARVGQVIAVGFVFAGFFSNPFLIVIGLFIFLGAQAEAELTQTSSILQGFRVRDVLMKQFQVIASSETIKTAVQLLLNGQIKNFLVLNEGSPVGTLSREEIIKALKETGEDALISDFMNRQLLYLAEETPLREAFMQMQLSGKNLVPVMTNGKLTGTVDMENILEFVMVRSAGVKHK